MLSKRFVPILLALLLVPAAASTAAPATPSPAPSVAPSWLGGSAVCAAATAQIAGAEGARTPASLPATPFDQRQNETGFCPDPHGCDDFCNNVCAPCGGYPYSQCLQNVNRPGCRAICWCYVC